MSIACLCNPCLTHFFEYLNKLATSDVSVCFTFRFLARTKSKTLRLLVHNDDIAKVGKFGRGLPRKKMNVKLKSITAALLVSGYLAACGGGSSNDGSTAAPTPTTLVAGQTVTLNAGDKVLVLAGTTVSTPDGNKIVLSGHSNTTNVRAGSTVSVPANATGAADNLVIAS